MRIAIAAAIGLSLGFASIDLTAGAWAAGKGGDGAKPPPSCAAITFHALAAGKPDGEQEAGLYKSRLARLDLHATVQGGTPVTYFVVANGNPLGAAPAPLPDAAQSCAAAKKMPMPGAPASSCTGERFTLIVAHAGKDRIALLYGLDGNAWRFCAAGTF